MVKNIPTIERSTKIRFGKNALDDQGENTIVLNASNTAINASSGGSLYISPVRRDTEYNGKAEVVLMMYNVETKELVESGESAQDLIGNQGFQAVTNQGNVTSNVVRFFNDTTAFVTQSNVGIANSTPGHTLSIGSSVYFNDAGSNVLVVSGGVSIDGNLDVNGGITTITSNNLIIEDAIIELGKNNTSGDTTLDLGLIMGRPGSNVTVGFREETDEIILAFTESSAHNNAIVPLTSEDINVHVYGRLYTESNVGVLNTNPMHTLDVGSNLYVDEFGSNILVVTGNTSVSGDLTVDTDTLFVDSSENKVGIKTVTPSAELHVVGNVYVSSNLSVDEDTFHIDVVNDSIGVGTVNPKANLHVIGNVYVTSNLSVDEDTFHIDVVNDSIGVGTVNPKANLHVIGNVYVSSNLTVDTNTLHVDTEADHIGINTVTPSAELHVVGNVFVTSNVSIADTTATSSKTTGALKVAGGVGVSGALFGSTAEFDGITKVTNNTTSGAKNAGALIVTGGVGITGPLFGSTATLDGVVNLTDDTTSTSATTGALKVVGGISTQENLHIGGVSKVYGTTPSDGKTAGALIVAGGVGVSGALFGADANLEDVTADSVTASGMVKGATISGTNVYGTLAGANTAAVTTLTASGMVKGATISGTNVYGTLAGANTAAVTTLTASGMVKGATISGTNVYGTLAGANTAAVTTLTASAMVKGATISGTNVYGTLAGANTAAVTTLTASGMVKGATISGTNVYGTLAGANTAAVTTLTASAMVKGATISGTNVYGTLAGSNAAAITTLNASGVVTLADTTTSTSATTGALKVAGGISTQENLNVGGDLKVDTSVLVVNSTTNRVGINKAVPSYALDVVGDINFTGDLYEGGSLFAGSPWTTETNPVALSYEKGNVGIGDANPAANLHVTGNVYVSSNLNVDANVFIAGGLVTNTGGVTKKTYSFTGALTSGQSIADSTIKITFSAHVFYAKIVAHLIESDDEVSTLSMECGGGHRTGGTPLVIAKGPISVFGSDSTNPWNSTVAVTTTTVALAPTTNMAAVGNYNIFIEYISAHASGAVTNIIEGSTTQITFGY